MLKITIPKQEYWDARTQEFVQLNAIWFRRNAPVRAFACLPV